MISRTILPAVLVIGLLGSACAAEESITEVRAVDASMAGGYRSDPARSGETSGSIGGTPTVSYRIDGEGPVIASPVLVDGIAFVPDGSGELIAMNVDDGVTVWRSTIGDTDASVVASRDSIFSVSGAGIVRRHDPGSGEVTWETELDGGTRSSPLLFDDGLWVAVGDRLAVLDPSTGAVRDAVGLGARADSSPAASGDVIVIGTRSNTLAFVDVRTLAVEFVALPDPSGELRTYADGVAATPVIADDAVYVGSTSGALLSLSLSGDVEWLVDVASPIYGAVAIGDGLGFVPTGSGALIAFDLDDGEVEWTTDLGDAAYSSPVYVDGIVLATAENGMLFAFDSESGTQLWSLEVGEPGNYMASSPAVAGSVVLLGSNDGSIVGVETDR